MEMAPNDFDRVLFYELARKTSESAYAADPLDADNLTRWGGVLTELAQFQTLDNCALMLQDAISKFEEALSLNPRKPDALWCLGNAQTSLGFFNRDVVQAQFYFDKARENFRRAVEEEPGNEMYLKSLALSDKALDMHKEIHTMNTQNVSTVASSASNVKSSNQKQKKSDDFTYDVLGWVILAAAAGIFAFVGMKSQSHLVPVESWTSTFSPGLANLRPDGLARGCGRQSRGDDESPYLGVFRSFSFIHFML